MRTRRQSPHHHKNRSQGIALAFALVGMTVLLILGATAVEIGIGALRRSSNKVDTVQAVALCDAGIDTCIGMMQDGPDGTDQINVQLERFGTYGPSEQFTTPTGGFTFEAWQPYVTAEATPIPGTVGIKAYGESERGSWETVQAVARLDPIVDPVFGYGLICETGATFANTVSINAQESYSGSATAVGTTTLIDGAAIWTNDAYAGLEIEITSGTAAGQRFTIASNTANQITVETGDLIGAGVVSGDGFRVLNEGKGLYAGGALQLAGGGTVTGDIYSTSYVSGTFTHGPSGATVNEQCDALELPLADLAYYKDEALYDGTYHGAGWSPTGNLAFGGSLDEPDVVYIEGGDVHLNNCSYSGYVVIVADSDVHIYNDFQRVGEGLLAIVADDVLFQGPATVDGLLYTKSGLYTGCVSSNFAITVNGGVMAEQLALNAPVTIEYDPRIRNFVRLPGHKLAAKVVSWEDV